MAKRIALSLKSIEYSGDSVGENIKLDIEVLGKPFTLEQTIKPGSILDLNQTIGVFEPKNKSFGVTVHVKVTEKDTVFDDVGEADETYKFDIAHKGVQTRILEVEVRERRKTLRKLKGVFLLNFEVVLRGENKVSQVSDPVKVREGFNPAYVLHDSVFEDSNSMTEAELQAFLNKEHKDKSQNHIAVMEFRGQSTAYLIKDAADKYSINPKLILAYLQKETGLVRGQWYVNPSRELLAKALGVGKLDDGSTLEQYKDFGKQIEFAAKTLRSGFDEAKQKQFTHNHVDGQKVTALNASTYSLYRYTPHFRGVEDLYRVYRSLFGNHDLGGPVNKRNNMSLLLPMAVFALITTGAIFFHQGSQPKLLAKNIGQRSGFFSYIKKVSVGYGELVAKLEITKAKPVSMEDGWYCGYRHYYKYDYQSSLTFVPEQGPEVSVPLTNPELFLPDVNSGYAMYYTPHDVDGDGRKQEFVIAHYWNCNQNYLDFVRVDYFGNMLEKIPVFKDTGERIVSIPVGFRPEDLNIEQGKVKVAYYDSFHTEGTGYVSQEYIYNPVKQALVMILEKRD